MLTIIARCVVEPGRLNEVTAAMRELAKRTLQEDGCIRYELHQDNDQANRFTFVELWETRALWQQHMAGPAIRKFNENISGGVIGVEVQEMTEIEAAGS